MAEVRGIQDASLPVNQRIDDPVRKAPGSTTQPAVPETPTGPPGPLGQPTGLPASVGPDQPRILSDVLAGRDPSQLRAAESLRERGGVSATDKLLGLDRQPSVVGAFPPPPGNSEALRHLTPAMRRTAMRNLINRQRERMHRLESRLKREEGEDDRDERDETSDYELRRARRELGHTALMLSLLEDLLVMQDETISQMGTFSKG
ncbi:MAG TPA: hypothetical protein VJT15_14850 [Pyrinomonadaceae bacterium]|nr:hypothetical protein [Pyrinomonadaceae bacterium]